MTRTLYRLHMADRREIVTATDPRHMTGEWAIIDRYSEVVHPIGPIWESEGWRKKEVLNIRPSQIISYTEFDADTLRPAGIPRNPLETPYTRLSPTIPYQCPRQINEYLSRGLICVR